MAERPIEQVQNRPWGLVTALLTGCAVTLLGVVRGFDPWVILQRAILSSLAVGCVVAVVIWALAYIVRVR